MTVDETRTFLGEVLWEPAPDAWHTAAGRFATRCGFDSYAALHEWSVRDVEGFWQALVDFVGVRFDHPPAGVLEARVMPGATWFPGATLSYADHALATATQRPDEVAVIARSQTRGPSQLTWAQLADDVGRCARALQLLGVQPGDRVAAYSPNIPETLIAFLAAASVGAIWTSCAPEFGVRSVIDRLSQVEPKVLIAVDGYCYGTRRIDRRGDVGEIVAALPSVATVIRVSYLGTGPDEWTPWLDAVGDQRVPPQPVPFDHPLMVSFSSGTTGRPKAIVHGHGGITVEHLKNHLLHQDLRPDDTLFWYTTSAWTMWSYLVSGLLAGTAIVLFDGDPGHPDLTTLWALAEETGATVLGASAPFLMACRREGLQPAPGRLRMIGSTGAPLPAEGFRWVHGVLGIPLSSIAGGTDVCTPFIGTSPLLPIRAGMSSGPHLGCAVAAFDATGRPCPAGETGELVITEPMPTMPLGFWGDDGTQLHAAYFADFPGVWRHGDWITISDDGFCVISGRSDATLNRGGVRLGTSEFYAVVEALPEVLDSLVVHLEDDEGGMGELVLFVVLAEGLDLSDDLQHRIRASLRRELSPRHAPDRIEVVPAVPRTLTGKKVEVPVKRVLQGATPSSVASLDALVDPSALEWFAGWS